MRHYALGNWPITWVAAAINARIASDGARDTAHSTGRPANTSGVAPNGAGDVGIYTPIAWRLGVMREPIPARPRACCARWQSTSGEGAAAANAACALAASCVVTCHVPSAIAWIVQGGRPSTTRLR